MTCSRQMPLFAGHSEVGVVYSDYERMDGEGAALPKGQITAQHRITCITERDGHGDEERCAAVVSGSMGEDKFVSVAFSGLMQEAANSARFERRNACRVHFRRLWPIRRERAVGCRDILPR